MAISTDTRRTAVSAVVGSDSRLSSFLARAPSIGETRGFASFSSSIADSLVVCVSTENTSGASSETSTTVSSTTDGGRAGGAIDTSTRLLAVSSSGTNAISVSSARAADSGKSVANLLVLGCSTVEGTTISVGGASLARAILLTVVAAIKDRAITGSKFTKISRAAEGINTKSRSGIALSLQLVFTTIVKTAISVSSASLARAIGLTILASSARTSAISQTSSGGNAAISVSGTSTATLGRISITDGSLGFSVRTNGVKSNGGSSSESRLKDTRTAGTFPLDNETGDILVLFGRIGWRRGTGGIRFGTSTEITDFHSKDIGLENV